MLFVCMGNICRSPTAEAVLRRLAPTLAPELLLEIDSAGTHDYHLGAPPDARSQQAARLRGMDMAGLRARRLRADDFERFDWIIVMDERNRRDALALAPRSYRAKVCRLLDFAPDQALRDVPDPYYGDAADFAQTLTLIDRGVRGLISALRAAQSTQPARR
ncbi:MAG TPA: low molecular weight protein-tyrosine-phosphatase [Steroidobacteraceae bacterium]